LVMLPFFADEIATMPGPDLVRAIRHGLRVAAAAGARSASLAGVLPSRTRYGYAVTEEEIGSEGASSPVALTTGHGATVVAVVKTVQRALHEVEMNLSDCVVAIVGFGAIGRASLELMLSKLPEPRALVICDLESQLPSLQRELERLRRATSCPIRVAPAISGVLPEAIYEADLIIGASTSGPLLDPDRLPPGTVVVDDSFPSLVDTARAIRRMRERRDVLVVGGGMLDLGSQDRSVSGDLPRGVVDFVTSRLGERGLPGCRVESLLRHAEPNLPPTMGLVDARSAELYWERVDALGLAAAPLHLEGFLVDAEMVQRLRTLRVGRALVSG
jgi:predicted amino acid dehydrogenase